MAVSASNLVVNSSGTNLSSYTTASISPTANALLLLAVTSELSGIPAVPSITGNGLTWVAVLNCYWDRTGTASRTTVFRAMGASPSAGTVVIDFAGIAQAGCEWSVDQFTGVDTSGADGSGAIAQSAKSAEPSSGAATSITVTLGAGVTAGNVVWGVADWQANEAGTGEGGSWATLGQTTHPGPSAAQLTQWLNASSDNSATTNWTTSALAGAIIIEIQAAGGAAATGFMTTNTGYWGMA